MELGLDLVGVDLHRQREGPVEGACDAFGKRLMNVF